MGENCGECRSIEDEIFWTNFKSIRFLLFLNADFAQQLAIPEKFSAHFKTKLSDRVTLKGPSGFTWTVGLTLEGKTLFFDHGWKEFVKDNFLKQNDILVVKYDGMSHFDILMFDGESSCEKAASYFVRKCEHPQAENSCEKAVSNYEHHESEGGRNVKRKLTESCSALSIHSLSEVKPIPPGFGLETETEPDGLHKEAGGSTRRHATEDEKAKALSLAKTITTNTGFSVIMKPGFGLEMETKPDGLHKEAVGSTRRHATKDVKAKALSLAKTITTNTGFLVIMKPCHVSFLRSYLTIPAEWLHKSLSKETEYVILSVNGRTWRTKIYYHGSKRYGTIYRGWKQFSVDNGLREFDECLFEPASPATNSIILNVTIIRAQSETQTSTNTTTSKSQS